MQKLFEDFFVKKCPSCNTLLKKPRLQEGHSCDCGFVWEDFLVKPNHISEIEI